MSQTKEQEIQSILNARQAQLEKLQSLMDSLSMELQQMSSLLENSDWPFLAPPAMTAGDQNHVVSHSFNVTSTPPASIINAPKRRRLSRRLDSARRSFSWAKNCSTSEIFAAAAA
jgi:hypothetical protein